MDVAAMLNMSESSFSMKLNGKTPWRLEEVYQICGILHIPFSDIPLIFPPEDVMA